jgi:hypothetical protein
MKIGVMFGNPETTPGGNALKFYSSVRIDIRKTAQIKKGEEVVGSRTKVKIVKNKIAAPFRTTEFDIIYNEGISKEGELIALGEKYSVLQKQGNSYAYGEEKLGRGYDATRTFCVKKKLRTKLKRKLKKMKEEPIPAEKARRGRRTNRVKKLIKKIATDKLLFFVILKYMTEKRSADKNHIESLLRSAKAENRNFVLLVQIKNTLKKAFGESDGVVVWEKHFKEEIEHELSHLLTNNEKTIEDTIQKSIKNQLNLYLRYVIIPYIQKALLHLVKNESANQEDMHKGIIKSIKFMVGLMPKFLLTDSAFLGRKLIDTFEKNLKLAKDDISSHYSPSYNELLVETVSEVFLHDVQNDILKEMFK